MNPLDQVDNVGSPEQARALRDKFLAELAKPNLTDTRALNLEDAIDRLEADWPELQDSELADAQERGEGRRRARERYHRNKAPSKGRRRGERAGGRTSRGRSGRLVGPRLRGYARRTGIPAAATTATDIALSWIGGTIGLILLYLFIANRRGNRALEDTIGAVSKALAHFVSPVDPLSPPTGRSQRTQARTAHGPPAGPRGPAGPGFQGTRRRQVGSHVGGG